MSLLNFLVSLCITQLETQLQDLNGKKRNRVKHELTFLYKHLGGKLLWPKSAPIVYLCLAPHNCPACPANAAGLGRFDPYREKKKFLKREHKKTRKNTQGPHLFVIKTTICYYRPEFSIELS